MMKCVDDRVNHGEENFQRALTVRDQLQQVASRWNPDAKIYLCGSVVTLGVLERNSDFDMCCLLQDMVSEFKVQSRMCEKFWKSCRAHVPHHLRDHLLGLAECRTPVVTLHCVNEAKLKHMQFGELTPEEEMDSRTAVLRLKTRQFSDEELKELLSKMPGKVLRHNVSTYNPDTGSGTVLELEMDTTVHAMQALSVLPDGKLLAKHQREDLIRDFKDVNRVPELLRFNWDCSFMGLGILNSYLIRKYLLDEAPVYARYCAMAIKIWSKGNYFGVGTGGYLTTYAISIMFLYFLLVTHNMKWINPGSMPHPVYLPRYPDYVPFLPEERPNPAEVGYIVAEFFRFYANFDWSREVVSLNRPRRSTRDDLQWNFTIKERENFHYHICIQDPYEAINTGGLNLGRWLHEEKVDIVKKEFASAAQQMSSLTPQQADQIFFGQKRPPIGQKNWATHTKHRR